jgi:hypothetical protein
VLSGGPYTVSSRMFGMSSTPATCCANTTGATMFSA